MMNTFLRRARARRIRAVAAAAALVSGLAFVGSAAEAHTPAVNPYLIDGDVPDDGVGGTFPDPFGADQELGPVNSNTTKLGVIHNAAVPMLALTNPNAQVDLRNVWLDTTTDADGHSWLYFAWERDSNRGSGVIMYEFQQAGAPAGCDYSLPAADLIAGCNPWANRQPGDFIIVWDQAGNTINIILRTWGFNDTNPANGEWDGPVAEPLALSAGVSLTSDGDAFAANSGDRFFGEAAINLSHTVFPPTPDDCLTIGNVIPGTVTGNSDTADYKDTVLADITDFVSISNCGSVKVTKVTVPADGTGEFDYTLARLSGEDINYDPDKTATGTLTGDGDSETVVDLIAAGDYTLTEADPGPTYALTSIVCDGTDVTDGETFAVVVGETADCVITNTLEKGTLIVKKVVINDDGGTAEADDFSFQVDGGTAMPFDANGENTVTVDAGTYDVTEPAVAGYTTTYDNCTDVVVAAGGSATCTITNDDQAATLIVKKVVVNDDGGTAEADDFSFSVNGADAVAFEGDGQNDLTVDAGTYSVTEPAVAGYTTTYDNCTDVVVPNGGSATCTITNNDQAGTLIVKKVVVNDNGGTAEAEDFSFSVNGADAVAFEGDGQNDLTVDAGTYSVTEPAVAGYTTTYDNCTDVVVPNGGSATCTITNNDQAASLIVKKVVINDNGGTALAEDFSFSVNGADAVAFEGDGQNDLTVSAGTYSVTEPAVAGYTTTYDNCTDVVLANGGTATCTITNNDTKASPAGTTVQRWVLHDSITITGLRIPEDAIEGPGTVTFRVFSADTCAPESQVGEDEVADVSAGGTASTSLGVAVTESGLYYWTAQYSGDQYNEGFTTDCGDEVTQILVLDAKDGGRNDFE